MLERLDVGCGERATGNVNLDLYPNQAEQRGAIHSIMNLKNIPNFVLADASHLPFKDKCFQEVFSNHVIEHLSNPSLFLKECIRVARNKVIVICPHRYARQKLKFHQLKTHKNFFNVKWFDRVLKNYRKTIKCTYSPKPHPLFCFVQFFHEITVTIYLRGMGLIE